MHDAQKPSIDLSRIESLHEGLLRVSKTVRFTNPWRHESAYRGAAVRERAQFVRRSTRSLTVAALYPGSQPKSALARAFFKGAKNDRHIRILDSATIHRTQRSS